MSKIDRQEVADLIANLRRITSCPCAREAIRHYVRNCDSGCDDCHLEQSDGDSIEHCLETMEKIMERIKDLELALDLIQIKCSAVLS